MVTKNPVVRDLVIPLQEFPNLLESQTLHDAVEELISFTCGEFDYIRYAEVLIFNDRHQLSGRVTLQNILINLDPRLKEASRTSEFEGKSSQFPDLTILWEDSYFIECRKWSNILLKDLMTPVDFTVKGNDPVLKALAVMINSKHGVLPVVDPVQVIGVIRMKEIFKTITAKCNI